jgi:hypothetical protein
VLTTVVAILLGVCAFACLWIYQLQSDCIKSRDLELTLVAVVSEVVLQDLSAKGVMVELEQRLDIEDYSIRKDGNVITILSRNRHREIRRGEGMMSFFYTRYYFSLTITMNAEQVTSIVQNKSFDLLIP